MQNILLVVPTRGSTGTAEPLVGALHTAGYRVARRTLDTPGADAAGLFCEPFEGRPPDVLLADLSHARDCLPLRHIRCLLRQIWGEEMGAPTLALFTPHHLALPDWPAYADDFLLPPYAPEEMLARLSFLLFRRRHVRTDDTVLFADVVLDLARGGARAVDGDALLPLTPREFDLMRFLVTHRGKFFARDRLLDMVWGVDFEGGERTVDIHVRRLRAKLPAEAAARLETRRGIGYGLRVAD